MSPNTFRFLLVLFGAAFASLVWLLVDFQFVRHPPIGGGGYNLDKFVYSALILLLTGVWSLGAFVAGLAARERGRSGRAFTLAGIGLGALLVSIWFFGDNLS